MKKHACEIPVKISRRFLTNKEIRLINQDIRLYPDLAYVSPGQWKRYSERFVLYYGGEFAGVCAVVHLKKWIKIGPFVLRETFKNKGLGTKLFFYIVNKNKKNLYIGSSNPAVGSITEKYGFQAEKSFFALPKEIQKYLLTTFLRFLNPIFMAESIRKLVKYGKKPYIYYKKNN
jgi:hypothetical protein